MTDDALVAKQARTIDTLTEENEAMTRALHDIRSILYSIGGPLNDNVLGYTNKQLGPFGRISVIIDNVL